LLEGGDGGEASEETDGDTEGDAGEGGAEEVDDDITEAAGAETLAHNEKTEAGNLKAFGLAEEGDGGQTALNPQGIPEGADDVDSPVASAILRRILMQRLDLLSKYGPEKVSNAIGDVADFVGDVDEIGSSDVSGWIKQVEMSLGGIDEGIIDKIKDVGQKALNTLGHGSDEDLLKDLKKRAGVRNPENGKPSMAQSDVEKVDEDEFAGNYATGEAGQWRNKGPKANKPATIGDLVGENFINTDAQAVVSEMDKSQTPPGRDGGDSDAGKKEYYGKLAKPKDVVKQSVKSLDKAMGDAHKKDVKEGQDDLAAMMRIINR
jgi:hypothetical protein